MKEIILFFLALEIELSLELALKTIHSQLQAPWGTHTPIPVPQTSEGPSSPSNPGQASFPIHRRLIQPISLVSCHGVSAPLVSHHLQHDIQKHGDSRNLQVHGREGEAASRVHKQDPGTRCSCQGLSLFLIH